jgi:hypothetical protein
VRTAFPTREVYTPKDSRTAIAPAEVAEMLAGLDAPTMPAYLAAKVADAIAAESASRLVTAR